MSAMRGKSTSGLINVPAFQTHDGLGDIDRKIPHPLQIDRDAEGDQNAPQILGDRLLRRDQPRAELDRSAPPVGSVPDFGITIPGRVYVDRLQRPHRRLNRLLRLSRPFRQQPAHFLQPLIELYAPVSSLSFSPLSPVESAEPAADIIFRPLSVGFENSFSVSAYSTTSPFRKKTVCFETRAA